MLTPFLKVGLVAGGCVTVLGLALSLTIVGLHVGLPLTVVGVVALVGFSAARMLVR